MRDIFNSRLPKPRYTLVWNLEKLQKYLMIYLIISICQLSFSLQTHYTPWFNSNIKVF